MPIIPTMPLKPLRKDLIDSFLLLMAARDIFSPPENLEDYTQNLQNNLEIIAILEETHYLNECPHVPKLRNIMELAWNFSKDPAHHHHFINMLKVSPLVFLTILDLIDDHPSLCQEFRILWPYFADQFMSGIRDFVALSGLSAAGRVMTVNLEVESVK